VNLRKEHAMNARIELEEEVVRLSARESDVLRLFAGFAPADLARHASEARR
jgi:hypothetical protein